MPLVPDKEILAVNGLCRFTLVPQEDFLEDDTMVQVGWAYQILFDIDGVRLLFEDGFKTEEDAINAGKERLKIHCRGLVGELQGKIALYEQVFNAAISQ